MRTIAILATALVLTACNRAAAPTDAASVDMSTAVKTGSGSGKITALDKPGGTITIAHAPIPAVGWPAMTMGFKADPKMLEAVAVGDKVEFTLSLKGNDGTVTAIARR